MKRNIVAIYVLVLYYVVFVNTLIPSICPEVVGAGLRTNIYLPHSGVCVAARVELYKVLLDFSLRHGFN